MRAAVNVFFITLAIVTAGGCGGDERPEAGRAESGKADTVATYATPGMAKSGVDDQRTGPGAESGAPAAGVPRIVDLGKGECIPCKMMAPILEELTEEYRGRVVIEVIDIGDKPESVKEYGMRVMPTQVFFDAHGDEVWRHEGFLGKEAIIEKLNEMGVEPPDG
jgi:thioredoxin 1